MSVPWEFLISTRIAYGCNSAQEIGNIATGLGMKKILLISDKGVVASGTMDKILAPLERASTSVVVFDEVEYNPTIQTVDKAARLFIDSTCDGVIAVGGGSPMDAGKCVGFLAKNPGSATEYLGVGKVKNTAVPVICVPTTAGTAAEITDVAMLSDPSKRLKMGIRSPHVAPKVALLDPLLTLTLPPVPTRDSGLDALTHAIESYININSWRITDTLTLRSIELIGRYLRTAVHNGKNIEARDGMLTASLLAGMGFHNTKLCLVHAITLPFGGIHNIPHGVSNAIVLRHAMKFLLPGAVPKFVDIAVALGEQVDGLSERQAAEKAISAVEQLCRDVNLPEGLRAFGVRKDELLPLAETIAANFMVPLSPRVANVDDILKICEESL